MRAQPFLGAPLRTVRPHHQHQQCLYHASRQLHFSSSSSSSSSITTTEATPLSPRWLSDIQQRIGKCITFGLSPSQIARAGHILSTIASDWRELVAGREGFLTSEQRRGIYRRRVIWGEQDSMGHVNNVVYNRYAETGRVEWAMKYARYIDPAHAKAWSELWTPRGEGLILRKITTEFKFPMKFPDHVTVYHKLGTEPTEKTDAFILDVLIMSELHRRPAARVVEDCALYDYRLGKKITLRPFMREVLRETWRLQEETKKESSAKVERLLGEVRRLEVESWDREDAVEDLGSAGPSS